MRSKPHDVAMAEFFKEDPAFALEFLNSILADGTQDDLMIAIRQMALAFGGVRAVAEQAELNPTQLYRTLSADGTPSLSSLCAILRTMRLRIAVEPIEKAAAAHA